MGAAGFQTQVTLFWRKSRMHLFFLHFFLLDFGEAAAATDLAEKLNTIKISDKPQEPHTATRDEIEQNIFQQGFASHWEGHVVPHDYTNPCNTCLEQFCSKECFESYLFIDSLK